MPVWSQEDAPGVARVLPPDAVLLFGAGQSRGRRRERPAAPSARPLAGSTYSQVSGGGHGLEQVRGEGSLSVETGCEWGFVYVCLVYVCVCACVCVCMLVCVESAIFRCTPARPPHNSSSAGSSYS